MRKYFCTIIFALLTFLSLANEAVIITNNQGKIVYQTDSKGRIVIKDFFRFAYDGSGRIIFFTDGVLSADYSYSPDEEVGINVEVTLKKDKREHKFLYKVIKRMVLNKKLEEIHGDVIAFISGSPQNKLIFTRETLLDENNKPFEVVEKEYARRINDNYHLYYMKYPVIRRFTRKIENRDRGWTEVSYNTNEEGHYSVREGKTFVNYITEVIYKPQSFYGYVSDGISIKTFNSKGRLEVIENDGRKFIYKYFYKDMDGKKKIEKLEVVQGGDIIETLSYSYPSSPEVPKSSVSEKNQVSQETYEETTASQDEKLLEFSEESPVLTIEDKIQEPVQEVKTPDNSTKKTNSSDDVLGFYDPSPYLD